MTNENLNDKDNLTIENEEQNEKTKGENIELNQEVNEEKEILDKNKEIEELRQKLLDKENECQSYVDLLKRTMADFDNFRKRTQKEKETIYTDGFVDAIKELLPVLDNLERAVAHVGDDETNPLVEGIQMTLKLFKDTLYKLGVEEIKAEGEKFDPNYHNAIMHIQDENYDENIIVEVFQKGYKYKDKIIRYSLVKVAN